jgi:hypothetical protein
MTFKQFHQGLLEVIKDVARAEIDYDKIPKEILHNGDAEYYKAQIDEAEKKLVELLYHVEFNMD